MPGTNIPDMPPNDWSKAQRREFRKAIIEECIDHLDNCGYYGASRVLRRDILDKEGNDEHG